MKIFQEIFKMFSTSTGNWTRLRRKCESNKTASRAVQKSTDAKCNNWIHWERGQFSPCLQGKLGKNRDFDARRSSCIRSIESNCPSKSWRIFQINTKRMELSTLSAVGMYIPHYASRSLDAQAPFHSESFRPDAGGPRAMCRGHTCSSSANRYTP